MPKVVFDEERCKGCEVCTAFCPKGILAMADHFNSKGFRPATCTDQEKCIGCAFCARMCPDLTLEGYK